MRAATIGTKITAASIRISRYKAASSLAMLEFALMKVGEVAHPVSSKPHAAHAILLKDFMPLFSSAKIQALTHRGESLAAQLRSLDFNKAD